MLPKTIQSLVLPPVLWLLLGAPAPNRAGSLALCGILLLHLYSVVWLPQLFRLLRGDRFTYGLIGAALNMFSFAVSYVVVWVVFHLLGGALQEISEVASYVWGFLLMNLLGTVTIPLLSHRPVAPLPTRHERRTYAPPNEK